MYNSNSLLGKYLETGTREAFLEYLRELEREALLQLTRQLETLQQLEHEINQVNHEYSNTP
jgi:hypothetical protein